MAKPVMLLLLSAVAWCADAPVRREAIEWTDVWMPHSNDSQLPRVLLIGDSITRAYYSGVEEALKGEAYVARIATSKAIGDPALLAELAVFLNEAKFDVVHFNIGMHGWAYSEEEYRQNLPLLVATIRKNAPGAKLIWGSTTGVRKDQAKGASNDRIRARNAIAREYALKEGIVVDDLNAATTSATDLHTDDVHFNKEGSALLAQQVADAIRKLLAPAPAAR